MEECIWQVLCSSSLWKTMSVVRFSQHDFFLCTCFPSFLFIASSSFFWQYSFYCFNPLECTELARSWTEGMLPEWKTRCLVMSCDVCLVLVWHQASNNKMIGPGVLHQFLVCFGGGDCIYCVVEAKKNINILI